MENLEKIISLANYKIRYERGVFQSDHCVLFDKRIIVINKFLPLEGKINVLIDVVNQFQSELLDLPLDNHLKKVLHASVGELKFEEEIKS